MFAIGDYVIYGTSGVCQVEAISPMAVPGTKEKRLYYTMKPCYIRASSIFTPVDNEKVVMRPVMTKDEALQLLERLEDVPGIEIREEKKREVEYKAAVLKCDPDILVGLLKTIHGRMVERTKEGKKVTSSDMKYFHIAEDSLHGELAISLDMDKNEVKPFIERTVKEKHGRKE